MQRVFIEHLLNAQHYVVDLHTKKYDNILIYKGVCNFVVNPRQTPKLSHSIIMYLFICGSNLAI